MPVPFISFNGACFDSSLATHQTALSEADASCALQRSLGLGKPWSHLAVTSLRAEHTSPRRYIGFKASRLHGSSGLFAEAERQPVSSLSSFLMQPGLQGSVLCSFAQTQPLSQTSESSFPCLTASQKHFPSPSLSRTPNIITLMEQAFEKNQKKSQNKVCLEPPPPPPSHRPSCNK